MVTRIPAPRKAAPGHSTSPLRTLRDEPEVGAQGRQALPRRRKAAATVVQKNVRRAYRHAGPVLAAPLSKVDTAWLRMDSSSNLMMINGVWTLSPGITWEVLCRTRAAAPAAVSALSSAGGGRRGRRHLVEDRNFDIAAHVLREKLPRHKAWHALQDRVGELAMQPLGYPPPVVADAPDQGFRADGSACARSSCASTTIADGIALISVTMSLLVDGGAGPHTQGSNGQESHLRRGLDCGCLDRPSPASP